MGRRKTGRSRQERIRLHHEWRSTRRRWRRSDAYRAKALNRHPLAIWPSSRASVYSGQVDLTIPRRFSLIENPDQSLDFLQDLRAVVGSRGVKRIHFDHRYCDHVDLCASVLMDILLITARREWKYRKQRVVIDGSLPPPEHAVHKFLVNSGVVAHIVDPTNVPQSLREGVERFPLVRGGTSPQLRSGRKEVISTGLALYFDGCLRSSGYSLELGGLRLLVSIVSEVLDNAELHGGGNGDWHVIGHFNAAGAGAPEGFCHVVLANFGQSIYQSLRRSRYMTPKLEELTRTYQAEPGERRASFTESTLWTLYGLQDGVSRLAGIPDEVHRGSGTIDMIKFFAQLSGGGYGMAIVSGDAYILNDGEYPIGTDSENNTILAFNKENSLSIQPDSAKVRCLNQDFPGTVISLRFPINERHLIKLTEENGSAKVYVVRV